MTEKTIDIRPNTRAATTRGFAIDPTKRYLLRNQTPKRIRVHDEDDGVLVLSPLSERVVCGTRLAPFVTNLRSLQQRHELGVREYRRPAERSGPSLTLLAIAGLVFLGVVLFDVFARGTLRTWETLSGGGVTLAVVAILLVQATRRERERRDNAAYDDWSEGDIDPAVGEAAYNGNETWRRAQYVLTLVTVVVVGALLPAVAIVVATDAKEFLVMKGGLRVLPGKESRLVSRFIQVTYTVVLTLFPALLYFQFDRQRVGTIRKSWIRSIFRMDRRMETLSDVNARYGDQISEASTYSTDSVRLLGGRHSPIVVATILVSLGWTLLVIRTDSFDFAGATKVVSLARSADRARDAAAAAGTSPSDPAAVAAQAAADEAVAARDAAVQVANDSTDRAVGSPPTTAADLPSAAQESASAASGAAETAAAAEAAVQQPFFQLLVSTPSAATMAFLGAYFFAVYVLLRGYFRGDLCPKIYNQITARLVTVVVLAYLINVLFSGTSSNRVLWTLSFLAGVVPTTVLQRLGTLATSLTPSLDTTGDEKKRLRKALAQAFATPRVLSQIDGIDLQEASRLDSEGYPDVAALARSDLVFVMVSTRLPIERLIDWTDQAVLILLVDDGLDEDLDDRIGKLRHIGVRTASSVLAAAALDEQDPARTAVDTILASSGDGLTLPFLASLIEREPAMGRILQWYASEVADVSKALPIIEEPPARCRPRYGGPRVNGRPELEPAR